MEAEERREWGKGGRRLLPTRGAAGGGVGKGRAAGGERGRQRLVPSRGRREATLGRVHADAWWGHGRVTIAGRG